MKRTRTSYSLTKNEQEKLFQFVHVRGYLDCLTDLADSKKLSRDQALKLLGRKLVLG